MSSSHTTGTAMPMFTCVLTQATGANGFFSMLLLVSMLWKFSITQKNESAGQRLIEHIQSLEQ